MSSRGPRSRRPSDRTLRRWLATGRPRRVQRLIETQPEVAARLDALSELDRAHAGALHGVVATPDGFSERVVDRVRTQRDEYTAASVLADLLGLGFHVGGVLLDPDEDERPGSG